MTSFQVSASHSIGYDNHPAHGIETKDGGIVATGFGLHSEENGYTSGGFKLTNGFVMKFKSLKECGAGTANMPAAAPYKILGGDNAEGCAVPAWETRFLIENKMTKLVQTYESPDGKFLMSVGNQETDEKLKSTDVGFSTMTIIKLDAATGKIIWTMNYGGQKNSSAALETATFDSAGNFIVGGLVDTTSKMTSKDIWSKSCGTTKGGSQFIGKISASDLAGDKAPEFEWTWQTDQKDRDYASEKY